MDGQLPHDVIVLAGGGGTRLGGVDKAALKVGGRSLLARVLDGTGRARRVVVVGETAVPAGVLRTVEDPPGGGPVAGIAAGLDALARATRPAAEGEGDGPTVPGWTLILAVDQPGAGRAVPALLAAAAVAGPDQDLVCPHDDEGHPQWLLAAYRTSALAGALEPFGTGHNISVRRVVSGLTVADTAVEGLGDIDTWDDHAAWQERLADGRGGQG